MNHEIKMISIERLAHHPNNPRKNLGDLTELTESIRKQGIMQNLTVVPFMADRDPEDKDQKYKVVIGNRRLEASKAAGLTELPCVIAKMDFKEQMATMLSENMQRADLTIAEQAEGIQLMMDLGLSEREISRQTGLSDTTVRRRVKLAQLPTAAVNKAQEKGLTIFDLLQAADIQDKAKREMILNQDYDGSRIRADIVRAINDQKTKEKMEKVRERLEEFAKPIDPDKRWNREYMSKVTMSLDNALEAEDLKPEDAYAVPYFYYICEWKFTLYCTVAANKLQRSAEDEEREKKQKMYNDLRKTAENITRAAYEKRTEFIKKLELNEARKKFIRENWLKYTVNGCGDIYWGKMEDLLGKDIDEEDDETTWDAMMRMEIEPERVILCMLATGLIIEDGNNQGYIDWQSKYESNRDLDALYELLAGLGYIPTKDELLMMKGEHQILKAIEEARP